jgi:hypothetical protein
MRLKAELFSRGYVVVRGLVSPAICQEAAASIRSRVRRTLLMMNLVSGQHFDAMLEADWMHSPDGWTGPPFGSVCTRGWQVGPGTGRIRASVIPETHDLP